ncbi:twin-arginine translocase subunit TatB [Paracoccus suum]|uniref:Sec-independent protein translocase protein TatB n=1 Tax=Paracoccus suum TaxID=2259340 RepID=A0A344PGG5_9RHOB|nr:Sec-independent protein translocase protein TatB [Paracoccus suum]AXC48470.1 twin-arginine translocase subunit TatB [Paracoccus suum]
MFDVGWGELLLIGVVALIVVGPEDLPRMFHTLGRMTAKARSMAREFSSAMEDAARESGIKEAADSLGEVKSLTSKRALGLDALDRAADRFEKWDPKLPSTRGSIRPDPAAAAVAESAASTSTPSIAAPAVASPASAMPDAPVANDMPAPEHGAEAPGRRSLKAVRRSDLNG